MSETFDILDAWLAAPCNWMTNGGLLLLVAVYLLLILGGSSNAQDQQ